MSELSEFEGITAWLEKCLPQQFLGNDSIETLDQLLQASDQSSTVVTLAGPIACQQFEFVVTKAYNVLRPGGALVVHCQPSPDIECIELAMGVFRDHGIALQDVFFDYAVYGTTLVAVKMSDQAVYLPLYEREGLPCIARCPERTLVYVIAFTATQYEAAVEKYYDMPRYRVVFAPTSMYGHHIAYHHVLPSRLAEWAHADFVGVISATDDGRDMHALVSESTSVTDADVLIANGANTVKKEEEDDPLWSAILHMLSGDAESLRITEPWLARASWMAYYCKASTEVRNAIERLSEEHQHLLWSPSHDQDRMPQDIEERMRMWGTTEEPRHRDMMARVPGLLFGNRGARVIIP